jgi:hypothetical protein
MPIQEGTYLSSDIEPLRKRIQGAVNRARSGAAVSAPVPADQRNVTRENTPAQGCRHDTVLRRHSFVVSQFHTVLSSHRA